MGLISWTDFIPSILRGTELSEDNFACYWVEGSALLFFGLLLGSLS